MNRSDVPPPSVPVLTEVVPLAPLAPARAAAVDEQALTEQVLQTLQRQIDLMLEYRLREVLAPLLAKAADGLVRDARTELAGTLREVVARAVAQELARQRGGR
jgi:hypothetical protein